MTSTENEGRRASGDIRVGCMGWSYQEWVGPFYPPETPAGDYLERYAEHFDTVELDTTFYHTPRPAVVRGWAQRTPDDFRFTAKLPREVTHDRRLRDADEPLAGFLRTMAPLGEKLGPILLQFPPDFHNTEADWNALAEFLPLLPADFAFAAEFRHRSWLNERTYELLRRHDVAWTIIELYYMPREFTTTADHTYIRLLGDRRKIQSVDREQIDRSRELDAWAEAIETIAESVPSVWVLVNNHYAGHSPQTVRQLSGRLGLTSPRAVSR
jgi:uncharacterized protein YecE (DUF72 family)